MVPSIRLHLILTGAWNRRFFGSLFRWVQPIVWSRVKALGRETLSTGGDILSDIAENKPTNSLESRDIVSKGLNESRQNLINKLSGRGRKLKIPAKCKRRTPKKSKLIKVTYFLNFISSGLSMPEDTMSVADIQTVSSEFDIFAHKPIQTTVLETIGTDYKPIAPVEHSDLEFLIPADTDTYIDLDIILYVRGKSVSGERKDLDEKDFTAVTKNFLTFTFQSV